MAVVLIGRWSGDGDLVVEESHAVEDGDRAGIDALVLPRASADGFWACEFLVDRHSDAVQRAYEEFARDAGAGVVDEVEGFEPEAA
ncbi:hypothetical protein GCM10020000_87670 [Streptomyces olivoverticillatus]